MNSSLQIAASILASDFCRLGEEICAAVEAGADFVHFDVMDGHFVPNITIGPPVAAALRQCARVPLHAHLMIMNPIEYVRAFADAGCDVISFHIEAVTHAHRVAQHITEVGLRTGIALNPGTSPETIRYLVDYVDEVIVMSVNPGFGGRKFIPESLEKIRVVRDMLGPDKDVAVDGGICPETAAGAVAAGANILVSGTAIFHSPDYAEAIGALRAAGESALV